MKLRCLITLVLVGVSGTVGAKEIPQDISVRAVVSTPEFQVTSAGSWWDEDLEMEYDPSRLTFKDVTKEIFVKSHYGPIYAKTDSSHYFFKRDGGAQDTRRYQIQLNRIRMLPTPTEIVSAADAAQGTTIPFRFYGFSGVGSSLPGTYRTHVTLTFETGAP